MYVYMCLYTHTHIHTQIIVLFLFCFVFLALTPGKLYLMLEFEPWLTTRKASALSFILSLQTLRRFYFKKLIGKPSDDGSAEVEGQ